MATILHESFKQQQQQKEKEKDKDLKVEKQKIHPFRPVWVPDEDAKNCEACGQTFSVTVRKHHCRKCGKIFCASCSSKTALLPPEFEYTTPQRVCDRCYSLLKVKDKPKEEALIMSQYYVRNLSEYSFVQDLFDIGYRAPPNKFRILLRHEKTHKQFITTFVMISPELVPLYNTDAKKKLITTLLQEVVKHPHVVPIIHAEYLGNREGVAVVTPFIHRGSLRDRIAFKASPLRSYEQKYFEPKINRPLRGKALDTSTIIKLSKELLRVMFHLKTQRIPLYHIHSGNILLTDDDHVLLTELENALCGLPPLYLSSFRRYMKVPPEVICFGHVLFEMTMGFPFTEEKQQDPNFFSTLKSTCPSELYSILESIFVTPFNSVENSTSPSLRMLMRNSLFVGNCDNSSKNEDITKIDSKVVRSFLKCLKVYYKNLITGASTSFQKDIHTTKHKRVKSDDNSEHHQSTSALPQMQRLAPSQNTNNTMKSVTTSTQSTSVTATASPPAPPPPPPPLSIPPSLLSTEKSIPPPQAGRAALLEAIRNPDNIKRLKKIEKKD